MKRELLFAALFLGAEVAVLPRLRAEEGPPPGPVGAAEASPSGNGDDAALRHWRMAERDKLDDLVAKMSKALNLTDEQKTGLRAAYEDRINKMSDLREKFIKEGQALEAAEDEKATSTLTTEQKAQYAAAKEKILADERREEMEKRKESHGGGEGGGRGGHGGHGGFGGGHGGGFGGPGGGF